MADTAPSPVEEVAPSRQSPDSLSAAESKPEEPDQTSRTATPVQPSSSPLPILTNQNRPSSVNSTHSSASAGGTAAVRTTTTSRRGGRIRSRSPPTMTNRSGQAPLDRDYMVGDAGDARPRSPKNPSMAAAAAAAAAKALSSGRNKTWHDSKREHHGEHPRYHPGYDNNSFAGARNWPAEEGSPDRRGFDGNRHPQAIRSGGHYDQEQEYGDGQHSSKRRHPDQRAHYDGRSEYESGRYGDSRAHDSYDHGGRPPPEAFDQDPRSARMRDVRQDYYSGQGMNQPIEHISAKGSGPDTPATVKRKGGTTRVIGTPTPIHVPRAADPPNSRFPPQGTARSVFRDRTDEMAAQQPEDNTPRILLSFRTPTTSFEESKPPSNRTQKSQGRSGPPLSPEEPPKIQHAHHQHHSDQPLFFEPQRSPRQGVQLQSSGTLEMAPSFSLFSQSFDSLGDAANYLTSGVPLDAAFQSYSFGAGPTGSNDNDNAPVQLLPSPIGRDTSFGGGQRGGYSSQQLLGGSSSGGMFTFGMSPENSFGNGPASAPSRHRGATMIVLGGADDGRPPSPTQVLGMYQSYSGGYGSQASMQAPFRSRGGPMGDGQDRGLSTGSFGPSMSQAYTRSFDGPPPGSFPGPMGPSCSQDAMNGALTFYPFLRRNRAAFIKCTFLLPGLKAALLESPLSDKKADGGDNVSGKESSETGSQGKKKGQAKADATLSLSGRGYLEPSPQDTAVAMRRIISSICAFGGGITGDRSTVSQEDRGSSGANSAIFRAKEDGMQPGHATVTPSSSSGTPPGNRQSSLAKVKYDELLPTRYYENENRLSWEFEEAPPVGSVTDDEDDGEHEHGNTRKSDGDDMSTKGDDDEDHMRSSPNPDESKSGTTTDGSQKPGSPDQPKMRYRCKLCGLPKQNHTCPYQQSLQRSIGTMVYPAVNAFTSNEPGLLAPALSEMNNFVNSGSESQSSPETSPDRPSPGRRSAQLATTPGGAGAHNVTPETLRSSTQNSPGSVSISTGVSTPQRTPFRTPRSSKRKSRATSNANLSGGAAMSQRVGSGTSPGRSGGLRKRQHSQMSDDQSTDLLFVDAIDLKPEQFRIVTPTKSTSRPDAFTYPALPLPYAQRKRLSDNLFALSKEVPQLTDECAVVLREAREKDMWDLAVAELMTQVVIVIHCHDGDTRFEGLRQYLLTLGIAC